jgi:dTDP-4-amino-4,6-dideoxygalactose transaminase
VIRIDPSQVRITRDQVIDELKAQGVGTSVHFIPIHLHPYYRDTFGWTGADFPVASDVAERILSLPLYPGLESADIDYVVDVLTGLLKRNRR